MKKSLMIISLVTAFTFSGTLYAFAADQPSGIYTGSSTKVKVEIALNAKEEVKTQAKVKEQARAAAEKLEKEVKEKVQQKVQEQLEKEAREKAEKAVKEAAKAIEKAEHKAQIEAKKLQTEIAKKLEERIKVRGKNIKFDVPPVIKEGRTLIPVRAVTESLGATVTYRTVSKQVTITKGDITVVMTLDSASITVNGQPAVLDVPAQTISNRTFVPLRFLAEIFGEKIKYDEETGEIEIVTPEQNEADGQETEAVEEDNGQDADANEEENQTQDADSQDDSQAIEQQEQSPGAAQDGAGEAGQQDASGEGTVTSGDDTGASTETNVNVTN